MCYTMTLDVLLIHIIYTTVHNLPVYFNRDGALWSSQHLRRLPQQYNNWIDQRSVGTITDA